jgi:hypothetical protein
MSKDTISVDVDELRDLKAKLAKLEMENSSLKKSKQQTPITFKVSTKKACSVYGLQRMPCTLYKAQWEILMDKKEELLAFLEENADELATKDDPKQDKTMKKKISKRSCDYDSNSDSDSDSE